MATSYRAPLGLTCDAPMANRTLTSHPLGFPKTHLRKGFLSRPDGPAGQPAGRLAIFSSAGELRRRRIGVICSMHGKSSSAITVSSWKESVLKSEIPVLVTFWASWCGPCRMVHQVIDEVSEEYAGRVSFHRINTDENPQIATEYGIMRIPTVLLFKNGEKQRFITGTMPKSVYVAAIEDSL